MQDILAQARCRFCGVGVRHGEDFGRWAAFLPDDMEEKSQLLTIRGLVAFKVVCPGCQGRYFAELVEEPTGLETVRSGRAPDRAGSLQPRAS